MAQRPRTSAQITRELNVNINVDITETIRGLKAIQREAKKAAQALRELEAVQTEYTHNGRRFRRTDYGNGYDIIEEVGD